MSSKTDQQQNKNSGIITETKLNDHDLKELAQSHLNMGNYEQAITYLSEVQHRNENDFQIKEWLAQAYYGGGQKLLALKTIEDLEKSRPIDSSLILLKAKIYEELSSYEKALDLYVAAYVQNPDNMTLWRVYNVQVKLRHYIEALTTLEKLQEQDADYISVLDARANLFWIMKKTEDAQFIYENILVLSPMHIESLKALITISLQKKNWKDLNRYAHRYLQYYTYDRDIVWTLVRSYEAQNLYAEALDELEKYKKYDVLIEDKIKEIQVLKASSSEEGQRKPAASP
ncbi:MAG: tetratricopeptide repeat protein [Pseudobdellovibrio sp.]